MKRQGDLAEGEDFILDSVCVEKIDVSFFPRAISMLIFNILAHQNSRFQLAVCFIRMN